MRYGHHIIDISWIKYICLTLYLNYSSIIKNSANIENSELIDYICHKVIYVIEFENLYIYFKIKVVSGIFG